MAATPEEFVRQRFLQYMVSHLGYPKGRIGVEVPLQKGTYRCDAVVYDAHLKPRMLIEFKADIVPLTQATLDQVAVYNRLLSVPWLILHNGRGTAVYHLVQNDLLPERAIPTYDTILNDDYPQE